jgi:hypothetical protein
MIGVTVRRRAGDEATYACADVATTVSPAIAIAIGAQRAHLPMAISMAA